MFEKKESLEDENLRFKRELMQERDKIKALQHQLIKCGEELKVLGCEKDELNNDCMVLKNLALERKINHDKLVDVFSNRLDSLLKSLNELSIKVDDSASGSELSFGSLATNQRKLMEKLEKEFPNETEEDIDDVEGMD